MYLGSSKLISNYIGPFRVLHRKGNAYTIELPRRMRTYPTFYVDLCARTINTRSLPRANTTATLKNIQEIRLDPSKFLNLDL